MTIRSNYSATSSSHRSEVAYAKSHQGTSARKVARRAANRAARAAAKRDLRNY